MPSWSEIFGRDVSLSQQITDSWNKYFGRDSDDSEEEEETSTNTNDYGLDTSTWPPKHPRFEQEQPENPEKTIEIHLYHNNHPVGAEVGAAYLEAALLDGWGYGVDIEIRETPDSVETRDEWNDFIFDNPDIDMAKDCNAFFSDSGSNYGGGSTAIAGRISNTDNMNPDVLRRYGKGGHYDVNMLLHEVGHALGLLHKHGSVDKEWTYDSAYGQYRQAHCATPMQTSYADKQNWTHRYSETARSMDLDVK